VQEVSRFLPLQWAFFFPIESLVGDLSNEELIRGLGIQLLWTLIGLAIFRIAWKHAVKRYSAVGG
jgi:viologen exporter family transport system permease protein